MEAKTNNYEIIYIRDEAHIGTERINKKDKENFENLLNNNSSFIIKMTATFDKKSTNKQIELKESELKNGCGNPPKYLLKFDMQKPINDFSIEDEELLDIAIKEFKKIREEYKKLPYIINPAMLIQVDNEPTNKEDKVIFNKNLEYIKTRLKDSGLSYVKYFGNNDKESSNVDNDNFTLPKITRINDPTDCIIFKIGPATGWDIPRACMLLQLRNISSKNLHTQTIGRIRRNPYPNLEFNEITNKYYILSNNDLKDSYDFIVSKYKVKDDFKQETFPVIKVNKEVKNSFDKTKLNSLVKEFLEKEKHNIEVKINTCFDLEKNSFEILNKKIKIKNPIILLKKIETGISNLHSNQKKVLEEIEKVYKNYFDKIKWEMLEIILLEYYTKDFIHIYNKTVDYKYNYKIVDEVINPDKYTEVYSKNDKNHFSTEENYLFDIDANKENKQYLDSSNEKIVADGLSVYPDIKVWAKNQTTGNIFGEYLDEFNEVRKSYFDFIIKFENNTYLYIEVKGSKDIDENKTKLLEKAYSSYFENNNMKYGLFEKRLIVCILKVEKDEIITPICFYDKNKLNINIDNVSFRELMKNLVK